MSKPTPISKKLKSKHSTIGASTCERWWNCPGSVALIATLPPAPTSEYAAEGTAAHELAERCLRLNAQPSEFVGQKAPSNGIEFTSEMADAVQVYLDVIRNDMAEFGVSKEDMQIENKFHLVTIDDDAYGTNDCNIKILFDRIIVYDYKHGRGVAVDVEDNKQLMYYALGAAQEGDYKLVEIVIVQPRALHEDGVVRRHLITIEDLEEFGRELKSRIADTRKPDAPLCAGDHCRKNFCPAMAVCPAVRREVDLRAMDAFKEEVVNLPAPETLSRLQLRRLLDGIPLIDAWTKAVWSYAEAEANAGREILGYKLVKGREGNRQWANEVEAAAVLEAAIKETDILEDAIYEAPKLLSPPKIEKMDKSLKKVIESLITRSEGRIIMVPESDPREGVSPAATEVFLT